MFLNKHHPNPSPSHKHKHRPMATQFPYSPSTRPTFRTVLMQSLTPRHYEVKALINDQYPLDLYSRQPSSSHQALFPCLLNVLTKYDHPSHQSWLSARRSWPNRICWERSEYSKKQTLMTHLHVFARLASTVSFIDPLFRNGKCLFGVASQLKQPNGETAIFGGK